MDKAALLEALKGFSNSEKLIILTELRASDGWWTRNRWWVCTTGAIIVSTIAAIFLTRYFFIKGEDK